MEKHVLSIAQNAARFSDKAHQIKPSSFEAFGITISSRYGKCGEIVELLQFAEAAALSSVAKYVLEVDYDSKASICAFKLDPTVVVGSEVERALFAIANETVSHFFWFDDEYFDDGESAP
jgi:hypothetical protein